MQDYGTIAAALMTLLCKDGFVWTDAATEAFEALKTMIMMAPVIVLPDFAQPFVIARL